MYLRIWRGEMDTGMGEIFFSDTTKFMRVQKRILTQNKLLDLSISDCCPHVSKQAAY